MQMELINPIHLTRSRSILNESKVTVVVEAEYSSLSHSKANFYYYHYYYMIHIIHPAQIRTRVTSIAVEIF